jgi:hypothetical protein
MIVVSDEMFDRVMKRAIEVAEEQFRRMVFDTGMRPEAAALFHDQVVDATAERYIENLAQRISDDLREKEERAKLREERKARRAVRPPA